MSEAIVDFSLEDVNLIAVNGYLIVTFIIGFSTVIILVDKNDRKFDKVLETTFDLTDPRKFKMHYSSSEHDLELISEVTFLNQELANGPKCYWRVGSTYRLDSELLLSFVNSVVGFTVMVVTTRLQIQSGS